MLPKSEGLLPLARNMRKNMTPQERKLWYLFLQRYPVKIYKQKIIDRFIVDFYCDAAKLVIEIDGSQHYEEKKQDADHIRSRQLEKHGLHVIRYSNTDINRHFREVCEDIHRIITERMQRD